MDKFTQIEIGLLFLTMGYGIVFGIGNTLKRFISVVTNSTYTQSELGRMLDVLFYSSIGYLSYVYWFM